MISRGCAFILLIVASAAAAQDRADEEIRPFDQVIFLSATGSREQVTCRILAELGDRIEVEKVNDAGAAVGKFPLMRSQIQEIIRRQTPEQVYKIKAGKLPRTTDPASDRARANLELGIWCRTPHPRLHGEPPMPGRAFGHLLKAAQIDPRLHAAYPHLIDAIASRRGAGGTSAEGAVEITVDQELEVYLLAEAGGYRDLEIDFRLGEIYLERALLDEARARFEAVLAWQGRPNQSLASRSRRYLVRTYLERGECDQALQLYRIDPTAAAGDPTAFEAIFQSARVLAARGRPEDRSLARNHLERARQLQPDFPGLGLQSAAIDFLEGKLREAENTLRRTLPLAPEDPDHLSALGLVLLEQGKFTAAEGQFRLALAKVPEGASPAASQARLGLGLIQDYRGNAAGTLEEYRLGRQAAPSNPAAVLLHARALLGAGDLPGARAALEEGLRSRIDDPSGFASCLRVLADVEIAGRTEDRALRFLTHALEIDAADPFLQRKVGVLLIRSGMLEAARQHLELARKLGGDTPETLNALGHYHYNRGDMAEAEKAFAQVLKMLPRPRAAEGAAPPPPIPEARLYAERAMAQVIDARTLEVWEDAFEREDGEEIHRGWLKHENFGIRIALRGGHVQFSGAQQNQADGVTKLSREVPSMEVERVSARFRFDDGSAGTRAGIRIESSQREVGAGLVFLRDFDGTLRFSVMTTRSDWEDGQPSPEKEPSTGKLVYAGDRKWPSDTGFHTLMIRRSEPGTGGKGFDLLLDGEPIAWNVQVGGLTAAAGKTFAVGISCQARSLGVPASFQADNVKVYRKKPEAQRHAPR